MSGHSTVVLVGGGHTHIQVLRRWAMDPPPNLRLVVVLDCAVAAYSGMVPGFVAGDYTEHELSIDVLPLARRAKAGVILSAAVDLDPVAKTISLRGRPPIRFDVASIDVGSSIRGLDLPGVTKHVLATRPIGRFVSKVDASLSEFIANGQSPRTLIVGGGAAGVELAFTIDARLQRSGIAPSLSIITSQEKLLEGTSSRTRRRAAREVLARGFKIRTSSRVTRVDASGAFVKPTTADRTNDKVNTESAQTPHLDEDFLPADLIVWATGAAPATFPLGHGTAKLSRDESGFLEIRDTLQCVGFDDVFAVGDCARMPNHPWIPRAGVYAVRQGPILERNLRARLAGKALKVYRPQRDFLSLLYLGNGRALASKWGMASAGSAQFRLKDWIDRRFLARFQILDEEGSPIPAMDKLGAMGVTDSDGAEEEMACGGCAAKLGAEPLRAALDQLPSTRNDPNVLLGLDARDDVAATRDDHGHTTLHNVDVIRAFCDDPWLVGRVAASNALSDLFAKGGRPRYAQAIVGLPERSTDQSTEMLFQTLSGIRATLDDLDVSLLGGHTTIGDELTVGLSVTGEGPGADRLLRQAGAQPGDDLLLAGPLGTGVILAADSLGLARSDWVQAVHTAMQHTNDVAGRLALEADVHAATDVTGFGLAGHLLTLLDGDQLVATIDVESLMFFPGAQRLWAAGHRSSAHPANRAAFLARVRGAREFDEAWLFDPQTSGGLLIAVAPEITQGLIEAFAAEGEPPLRRIGRLAGDESQMAGSVAVAGPTLGNHLGAGRIELHIRRESGGV